MTRLEINKLILERLEDLIEQYPEQRFGQLISNYIYPLQNIQSIFYEESINTLDRLDNNIPPWTKDGPV